MPTLALPDPIVIVAPGPQSVEWTAGVTGTWAPASLPVAFHVAGPHSRDIAADEDAELDVALRAWPGVSCTGYRATVGPPVSAPAGDDGVNGVYFEDATWPADLPPGVLATTVIHVDATGHYRDADIHLNGAQYKFSLDGRPGTFDVRSVLTHELGHALGLGHSSDARATMYASDPGGVAWRSLEQDDRDGVCALYPGAGLTAGCEALPCPAGLLCVARSCERPGEVGGVCSPCARVLGACAGAGDDARCVDYDGGRACGRSCSTDLECGQGFRCAQTTAAGDLQCVALDSCVRAANTCTKDADCTLGRCVGGACLGPLDALDAGAADASDAGAPVVPISGPKGGCCASGAEATDPSWLAALALVVGGLSGRGSGREGASSSRASRRRSS